MSDIIIIRNQIKITIYPMFIVSKFYLHLLTLLYFTIKWNGVAPFSIESKLSDKKLIQTNIYKRLNVFYIKMIADKIHDIQLDTPNQKGD